MDRKFLCYLVNQLKNVAEEFSCNFDEDYEKIATEIYSESTNTLDEFLTGIGNSRKYQVDSEMEVSTIVDKLISQTGSVRRAIEELAKRL